MSVSALNPPEPYSAIIFDCDGTLVDSTRLYFRAWNTLFGSYGAEMSWDWFAAHLGCSWPQIFEEYQQECGISVDAVLGLQEFNRAYRNAIDTLCEIEIVADVARRHFGRVRMAVASGGTREIVEATLLATKLLDLFEAVVTIEDVHGRGKPDPDMYLEAARRLRVPPNECTVFEDSDEGIEAARRAGMSATDVRLVYRPAWRFALQADRGNSAWEPSMSIVIRAMALTDISAARILLSQLGYEMNTSEVERRYNAIRERGDHAVFVAEKDGRVIGFLHLYERPAFDKPPAVIVQAIVVDQSLRGTGIGKTIMSMAERWALERGFSSIALTSNISRSGAHWFYNSLGYKIEATSHLFRKQLEGQSV